MLGLFLESELSRKKPAQNLKRSLLVVRRNLERLMAKDPPAYREPLNRVTRALQNIELRQLINLAERQEMKSWQIPYWSGSELASARLYIKRELAGKSKTKRKTTTRLTLMMEMSRLGPIRVELLAYREKMEGTFYLLTEKAAGEIGKKLPELVEALKRAGFTAGFGVQRAARKFLTEELLNETALPVKRLLNVKV
jgi:hypothetical protein